MTGITKRFPGVLANDHVDFDLRTSEIHALLGENGAGKTTLMKILYGLYRLDEGEIRFRGEPVTIRSPKDSINLGIGMIHQHFALVPNMTVTENIMLGLGTARGPLLNLDKVERKIADLSKAYNLRIEPRALIEQLSVGERQRVEILRTLYRGAQILILDEPTSVLTPQEIEDLFKMLRGMVGGGGSVVFITHKLREVMAISNRITVLRHGRVTARVETRATNPSDLAEKMVGREVEFVSEPYEKPKGGLALEVEGLSALGYKGIQSLKDVSFTIMEGEMLGIAGVAGNGQRELAEVITGMSRATSGRVKIFGRDLTNHSPKEIIEHGVGHIPEDRQGMGLIMDFSIAENLILEVRSTAAFAHKWFLPFDRRYFLEEQKIRKHAENLVREYEIAITSVHAPARTLSGGNLQKLILAKVLSREPRLLVAEQPTAGLDVGASEFIWQKMREERQNGTSILLISSDLNEIMSLSDCIAVMYEGKIVGVVPIAGASIQKIGLMMGGALD